MKKYFLLVLLFSPNAQAETFLCIGEAGAYVAHAGPGSIESGVFSDTSSLKLLLSDESGIWEVKMLGEDHATLICETENFCRESPAGENYFGGVFMRSNSGVFTIILIQSEPDDPEIEKHSVAKGRCSKL